jgi:hypothetical protein
MHSVEKKQNKIIITNKIFIIIIPMFSKIVLFLFIILFIFVILLEVSSSPIIEGLTTTTASDGTTSGDGSSDLGVTVGRYTSKIDQLGKTIDSMQATILGLLPTVAKNKEDNAKNQQAIQAIITNKNK